MNDATAWLAALATVAVLLAYEGWLALALRRRPDRVARSAHAGLREDWFDAVSAQPGSEILAVQTLRNSVMAASITASASVLSLTGTLGLAAPSLAGLASAGALPAFTPRLALELGLIALLFSALVSSVMAIRYFNHAGFIGGMPVQSKARQRWSAAGCAYVRRGGTLYSWSLRSLVLVVPVLAFLLHPLAGPVAAVLVVAVLQAFDRVQPRA